MVFNIYIYIYTYIYIYIYIYINRKIEKSKKSENRKNRKIEKSAHGPRPTAHGPRPTAHGPRPTAPGPRPTAQGPRPTAHGPRPCGSVFASVFLWCSFFEDPFKTGRILRGLCLHRDCISYGETHREWNQMYGVFDLYNMFGFVGQSCGTNMFWESAPPKHIGKNILHFLLRK